MSAIALDHRAAANVYESIEHNPRNREVAESYAVFTRETIQQWDALSRRYKVDFFTGDPAYANSAELFEDLATGHAFSLLTGTDHGMPADHPMLQGVVVAPWEYVGDVAPRVINDIFRVVHDVNGHGTSRGSFGITGEMNAWLAHRMFYSPAAHLALWCETRGQAAWTNAYGNHAELPLADRPFATQKAGLVPAEYL